MVNSGRANGDSTFAKADLEAIRSVMRLKFEIASEFHRAKSRDKPFREKICNPEDWWVV